MRDGMKGGGNVVVIQIKDEIKCNAIYKAKHQEIIAVYATHSAVHWMEAVTSY